MTLAKPRLQHFADSAQDRQEVIAEQLDERAADDQVLLDLPLLGPRDDIAPGDDVL